ncbi:MAG TPA: hypothetical protein ENF67_00245, partial [Candidatus Pacearchaeota archaeon]|nr:hypothetical protein [Candidatus Pacearchaeota archaeon]
VVQKEYAVISGKKGNKKVANTYGLADCIGLVLYDKDNQIAAVAHIDGGTDIIASIPKLIYDLSEIGGKNYQARLFGGDRSSAKKLLELIDELRKHKIEIVEADILEGARTRAIGISTEGVLYNNVFYDGDPTINYRKKIVGSCMNVPLKCHYKPH